MPREHAERLLAEREGAICARLYRRADGTVLTADCPEGVKKKRVRLAIFGAVGAGVLAAASVLGFKNTDSPVVMQGDVAMPTPTTTTTTKVPSAPTAQQPPKVPEHVMMGAVALPQPPKPPQQPKAPTK
jgi:hypothetical protein